MSSSEPWLYVEGYFDVGDDHGDLGIKLTETTLLSPLYTYKVVDRMDS